MADDWLGISSAELDSSCGAGDGGHLLTEALDGTDFWRHTTIETHWFVIDLGSTHTIKEVRGRSLQTLDPTDVNIYIDDSNPPTTLCEEGITTWQDTDAWVEITLTTEGSGRYIKVEIEATESIQRIQWGGADPFFTIFDAFGDVAGGVVHTHSASDTMSISDSVSAAATYKVSLADTLAISDSVTAVLTAAEIRRRLGRPYGLRPARVAKIGRIGV